MLANHEVERAILAVAVQHGGDGVLGEMAPGLFDSEHNRTLFQALQNLHLRGKPLDEPTLLGHLDREKLLGSAGGKAGVAALYYHDTALRTSIPSYLAELRDAQRRRQLAETLVGLARSAETSTLDLDALIENVETEVLRQTRRVSGQSRYVDATTMTVSALDLIEAARQRGDGLVGFDTGLPELNDMIGGWENGTFTVMMGPPGVGKTAMWLQSAIHVSKSTPIAMVQLEMTPAKMGMRALSNHSRVSFSRMRRGNELHDRDWSRLSDAAGQLSERKAMIAPNGLNEWSDIKAWFRRMHLDHGAQMLWLDNIKIVGMAKVKPLDRFNALTRELKTLSTELNVPVCAIHHLHRLEEGKAPTLTSGYGSSSIEQDADNVIALWKPEPDMDDEVQILPLKTRDDFSRPKMVQWHGDQQRYASIAPDVDPLQAGLPYRDA